MVFVRTLRQSQSQSDQGPSDLGPDDPCQVLAALTAEAVSRCNPPHPYALMDAAAAAAGPLEDNLTYYLLKLGQLWLSLIVGILRRCPQKDGCTDPTLLLPDGYLTPTVGRYKQCHVKPVMLSTCCSPHSGSLAHGLLK